LAAYMMHGFGLEPTSERVDRLQRLLSVGQPMGRLNRYLWADSAALARHGSADVQKEVVEYAANVRGIAKKFKEDLRQVKTNGNSFEALSVVAAIGEHIATRQNTAVEVVKRIQAAEKYAKNELPNGARHELLKAAKAVRRMKAENAKLLPSVLKFWAPYYGDAEPWWFTNSEVRDYTKQLASRLEELAKNPDAEGIHALLGTSK